MNLRKRIRGDFHPEVFRLRYKLKAYTQPVGFGRPAYLHACLPGPYGNKE